MRPPRPRGSRTYAKPALSETALTGRLSERGLRIPDDERCRRYLRHIGYYRLSPYMIPFQVRGLEHTFRDDADFDAVLDLYVFDRKLRLLVLDALERIEVALRSALTDHMSLAHSGPHWYVDPAHFSNAGEHGKLLGLVDERVEAQRRRTAESASRSELSYPSALEHYVTTYGEPARPPSWLMVEELTLGQLTSLVKNLTRRGDRSAIAKTLGINDPLMLSWLPTYVRVRNICAHHGRLWNVGLGLYPALPTSRRVRWLERSQELSDSEIRRRRLYPVLASMQTVLFTISPRSSWAQRLDDLLAAHPDVPLEGMGMPADWRRDTFWMDAGVS